MSDTDVDIAVRWNEGGQDVPARTAAGLHGIRAAAGEAAPAVGDRMAQAFARLEAREPTMVLRRARGAVEELTASALGSTGPLGRLGASVAMLGGATSMGAVAGFAAIGLEIKTILEYADQLDKQLLQLNTTIARGPATLAFKTATFGQQVEDLESPGFWDTIKNTVADMITSGTGSYKESGAATGRAARLATARTGQALAQQDFERAERGEQMRGEFRQISLGDAGQQVQDLLGKRTHFEQLGTEGGKAWAKALLDAIREEAPEKAVHDLLTARDQYRTLGAETAAGWTKSFLEAIAREHPDQAYRDLLANRASIEAMGATSGEAWKAAFLRVVNEAPGLTPRHLLHGLGVTAAPGPLGHGLEGLQTYDFLTGGPGAAFLAAHAAPATFEPFSPRSQPLGTMPKHPFEASDKAGEHADQVSERNGERIAAALGRELGPLIAMMSGGGARGVVAGLSGVTGTLASLNDPKGHPLLGSAAPYLSLASGVLSGMSALFGIGGQKPKVIITAFEEEAARQIKELRSDPATTQFIIIGSTDMRSTQQQLARLQRMGVITRLPR